MAAPAALSPLIALLVGFVGTDRWLRRQFRDKHDHTPLNGAEDNEVRRQGVSSGFAGLLHPEAPARSAQSCRDREPDKT